MSAHLTSLEQAERDARNRLQRYRAKAYFDRYQSPMASQIRLAQLERNWKFASEQLRKAQSHRTGRHN